MRALIVTNMYPRPDRPALGSFVRDQVRALEALENVELEVFPFASAGPGSYARAGRELRRRYRGTDFDVVHAHFGLTAWPALTLRGVPHAVTLHGTDVSHRRSRPVTLAALPLLDLVGAVSEELAGRLPRRLVGERLRVLPCGVDTERFRAIPRVEARRELGLEPGARYLLFPADPGRPEKRFDRARAVAEELPLLTLGGVEPDIVPLWVNAADAVLIPSEREGFGLAVLEALACGVPVLATPVGIAPGVLRDVPGTWCGAFDTRRWRSALAEILERDERPVAGREVAERFSASRMAQRVLTAWQNLR